MSKFKEKLRTGTPLHVEPKSKLNLRAEDLVEVQGRVRSSICPPTRLQQTLTEVSKDNNTDLTSTSAWNWSPLYCGVARSLTLCFAQGHGRQATPERACLLARSQEQVTTYSAPAGALVTLLVPLNRESSFFP